MNKRLSKMFVYIPRNFKSRVTEVTEKSSEFSDFYKKNACDFYKL